MGMLKHSGFESKPLPNLPTSVASAPLPTSLHTYNSESHRGHVQQTSNDPEYLPQEKTGMNEKRGTQRSGVHKQVPFISPTRDPRGFEIVSVGNKRREDAKNPDSGTDRPKDYSSSSSRGESSSNPQQAKRRGRSTATSLPMVLPFMGRKRRRPSSSSPTGNINSTAQSGSNDSPAVSLIFESDSENYDETESDHITSSPQAEKSSRTFGYGWGLGKKRQHQPGSSLDKSHVSEQNRPRAQIYRRTPHGQRTHESRSAAPLPSADSIDTLVGSAPKRKMLPPLDPLKEVSTTERLENLRRMMATEDLDYYVVPSGDEHGSEYLAASDRRREFISGFTGPAGEAIISRSAAYIVTDFRYWHQAEREVDLSVWTIIRLSTVHRPRDWIEWLLGRVKDAKIGIDARMISHEKLAFINSKINSVYSKIVYPRQNLVDIVWRNRPMRSQGPVLKYDIEYAGQGAHQKLDMIRDWIREHPSQPSHAKGSSPEGQRQVGTLLSSLPCIAWALNLYGSDIPYRSCFHAYLYVGLDKAVIFLEGSKVDDSVADYLRELGIERRDFIDVWRFLRQREWGEGKILLSPFISSAVAIILTQLRYTIAQPYVEYMMAIKNDVEVEGLRRAYLRDSVALVRFLAWLDEKLDCHFKITEWEASYRLTEFRRVARNFMGLAHQNTSATGPNAALPNYTPLKSTALVIDSETPYLIDSGGSYLEGACCTIRTMHYGRPTQEQRDAYTRVLQSHIAVDSAVFPEGTAGLYLDSLATKVLWKDDASHMQGVGQGFGSVRTAHLRSNDVPLVPGHVVINESCYYKHGSWGVRIGSALVVTRVRPRDVWLDLERLTCVPIQTRMVKESMLTKEEKVWIKEHNQRCFETLSVYLKDDKRALDWLKRET